MLERSSQEFQALVWTMKKVAAALREAEVGFALAGSFALWARGGPETVHDIDILVLPEDAEAAAAALREAGMPTERPPEGWLIKAWDGDVLVDVIWELSGIPDVAPVLERAHDLRVQSVSLRVVSVEDALTSRMLALDEHTLDLTPILRSARAVREQVDWAAVRERTAESPYARAFLTLLDELGVVDGAHHGETPRPAGRDAAEVAGPHVRRASPL